MRRAPVIALCGALVLVGCQDLGLEDNLPLEEAEGRPPSELVVAVMGPGAAADREIIVAGRLWVPSGLPQTLQAGELVPVGSSGGTTVYARSWDEAPYDALFTRLDAAAATDSLDSGPREGDRWLGYEPVIGRAGGVPSAGPADESGDEEPGG
jgi:hypothetical protein